VEGVADERQSGGCRHAEGCGNGSKLPIEDVMWGVPASKWRAQSAMIARCNSVDSALAARSGIS
jgi:hypothetical protein